MYSRKILAPLAVCGILLLTSGCANASGSAAGSTIKIGVVGDSTGAYADQFGGHNPQLDGIHAAIQQINADGGIDGKAVEAVDCDTQSTPARGPICAQQFISKGVLGIVGFSGGWSPTGIAATDKAGILNFTYPNTTQESDNPNSWTLMGGGLNSYPAQTKYFTVDKGLTKAAIMYVDIPLGATLRDIYVEALDRFGVEDVEVIAVPTSAADVTPYVTAAQKSGAEVIYGVIEAQTAVKAIKAADQIGYEPAWALGDGAIEKNQILEPLGDLAEGKYGSSATIQWTDPSDPETKVFLDAMAEYEADAPIYQNTATGFATMMTLSNALAAYEGELTSAAFGKFLSTIEGVPVYMGGGAELDASKAPAAHPHDLNAAYNLVQWQNGEQVIVATAVSGWEER